MRKITLMLLAGLFAVSSLHAGLVYVPESATDNVKSGKQSVFSMLDAQTFLALTPAKVKEMTGKKMSLGEKVSLKIAQMEVKKQLKKGEQVDMAAMGKKAASGISALWLILGLLLGLIGVIIALVTKKGADDNRVKSALIGWLIWIAIVVIAYAA
jgi:hypothetical protein